MLQSGNNKFPTNFQAGFDFLHRFSCRLTFQLQAQKTSIFYMNPISLKATLPSGGICFVGHALPIEILAANGSSSKLPGIKLSFNMTLVLNANGENFTRRIPILAGTSRVKKVTLKDVFPTVLFQRKATM